MSRALDSKLEGLIHDLDLHPFATTLIQESAARISDPELRGWMEDVLLAADPASIRDAEGPYGTPYDAPMGRSFRTAVALRALEAILWAKELTSPADEVLRSAVVLAGLAGRHNAISAGWPATTGLLSILAEPLAVLPFRGETDLLRNSGWPRRPLVVSAAIADRLVHPDALQGDPFRLPAWMTPGLPSWKAWRLLLDLDPSVPNALDLPHTPDRSGQRVRQFPHRQSRR